MPAGGGGTLCFPPGADRYSPGPAPHGTSVHSLHCVQWCGPSRQSQAGPGQSGTLEATGHPTVPWKLGVVLGLAMAAWNPMAMRKVTILFPLRRVCRSQIRLQF